MIISNEVEKGKEEPFNLNSNNIKKDLIHFKDDVLKDIKFLQKTVSEKLAITSTVVQEKLESYDNKFKLFNEKISQLSNLIVEDKDFKDKVDKLYEYKLSIKDNILTNEIKLTNLEKEYNDKINKINQILTDTVIYPSVIGGFGKFKTFHEFIDYIITQISKINIYREKNTLDLNSYKNKLETLIKSLQFQLDNIVKSNNEFTTKSVNECEERIKNTFLLYDDRIKDVRVENQNYAKSIEQYYNDLKEEFKKFITIKNNIYNRFNNEIYYMKRDNLQVVKIFGNYKKEFNLMKDRLTKLSEFIKDVRFRINLGQEIKRREFINMSNQLDFGKKQSIETTSGVKKYIHGEINAEELSNSRKSKMSLKILKERDSNLINDDMINNYIYKNRIFEDNYDEYSSRNSFLKSKESFSSEYGKMSKRMSVNNLINPFSLRLYKRNSQNDDLFEKKSLKNNYSNGDINNMGFNLKNIEKIGKKRNTTFIGNKNLIFKLQKNDNNSRKFIDASPIKKENNITTGKNTIKEEEEINSKKSQSSSSVNSNKNKKKQKIMAVKIKDNENIINNINKLNLSKSEKIIIDKNINKSGNITKNENFNKINLINKDKDFNEKMTKNNGNSNNPKNSILFDLDKDKYKIDGIINENNNKYIKIDMKPKENQNEKRGNNKNIEKKVIDKNEIIKKINTKSNKNIENLSFHKLTSNNDLVLKDNININNISKEKFSKTFYNPSKKDNNNINNIKMNFRKNNNDNDNRDESNQLKGKKFANVNNLIINKMISQNQKFENLNKNQKTLFKSDDYNINNIISFNSEEERRRMGKHYKILNERNIEAQRIQKMVNNLRSYIDNYNNNLEEFNNTARNTSYKNGKNYILKKINSNNIYIRNNSQIGNNSQRNKNNIIKLI